MRIKPIVLILGVIFFITLFLPRLALLIAQTPTETTTEDRLKSDIRQKIQEYEQKLSEIRTQKNTLSAQIDLMDTQMYLTNLRINQTQEKIQETEKEIDALGVRISNLDSSLDKLSKILLERIVAGYKNKDVTLVDILLNSANSTKLISRLKYYELARERNQKSLLQAQEAKSNFEEQKNLREKKVEQLDALENTLNKQQLELEQQKSQKQKLLSDTQNNESVYQNLLRQAQEQLSSFRSFVQSSGAGGIIPANNFGNGSDGAYYSQRDARWATNRIGYSNETILDVGCLLTSIAMVGKKLGQDVSPASLAGDYNRFWGNTAWMKLPWPGVAGKSYQAVNDINAELDSGNYVIAGVRINNCNSGGNHFVVLIKREGDSYVMHDPIYGPDTKFNDHYSTICSSATFK